MTGKSSFRFLLPIIAILIGTLIFNEYLIYYSTIYFGCDWPKLSSPASKQLKIAILSDTHLLGPRRGHWFDKLRREWQMHRSFQTSVALLKPEAIFVLGDLFDEGIISNKRQLLDYVERFNKLFHTPDGTKRYSLLGNHDIGFHNEISPSGLRLLSKELSRGLVDHVILKDIHFVLLNSMAMERDGCRLCSSAEHEIERLSEIFGCGKDVSVLNCTYRLKANGYSPPILMQHIPLFRLDDAHCVDDFDTAPDHIKIKGFKEGLDCISKESTDFLLNKLRPRAVFDGHIHYSCQTWRPPPSSVWEWTVSSFSWRNTPQPSFLLVSLSPDDLAVQKCFLPNEKTVIVIYLSSIIIVVLIILNRFNFSSRKNIRALKFN